MLIAGLFLWGSWVTIVRATPQEEDQAISRAVEFMGQNQPESAEKLLEFQALKNPKNQALWFNLGGARLMAGHGQNAISAFKHLLTLNPPFAPLVRIYLARAYRSQGDRAAAVAELQLIDTPDSIPEIRELIQAERARLNPSPTLHFSSFHLEAGGGYTNNVDSLHVQEDGSGPPLLAKGVAYFEGSHKGSLLDASVRLDETLGLPAYRSLGLEAEKSLNICKNSDSAFLMIPQLRQDFLNNRSYFFRAGARSRLETGVTPHRFELEFDYLQNIPERAEYSYLKGFSLGLRAGAQRSWNSGNQLGLTLITGRELSQDLYAGEAVLPLTHWLSGFSLNGVWAWSDHTRFLVQNAWIWKFFDLSSQPYDLKRTDLSINFAGKIEQDLGLGWGVFLLLNESINQSTLGRGTALNRNYSQLKTLIGLKVDIGT